MTEVTVQILAAVQRLFPDVCDRENFMIKNNRKSYVVGEMLDWEAPTGGYLLQACISNGAFVAKHIIRQYS